MSNVRWTVGDTLPQHPPHMAKIYAAETARKLQDGTQSFQITLIEVLVDQNGLATEHVCMCGQ